MPSRLMLTFSRPGRMIGATLGCYLACLWFMAGPAYALDPNKRITQYLHKSWRTQDGSLPAAGNSITQTLDGFLWLGAGSQGMYRFDGVRFVPWPIPIKGKAIKTITNVHGDRSGGLWVLGEREIIHLKAWCGRFSSGVARPSTFRTHSRGFLTAPYGWYEANMMFQTRLFAESPTARFSVSVKPTGYRLPRQAPYWPNPTEVSGSEGRRRSFIGVTAPRSCTRLKGSSTTQEVSE